MKPERWKQATPADQLQVILGSLEGHLSNWEDGIISAEKFQSRAREHLLDLQILLPHLRSGEWK